MKKRLLLMLLFATSLAGTLLSGCSSSTPTPDDSKHLSSLHELHFSADSRPLKSAGVTLFVDYSTCIALGQHSPFFNKMVPSLVDATRAYYAIEGSQLNQRPAADTYQHLRSIAEVNYADLKAAVDKMADLDGESVLLTDGEYFQPSIAKGNVNNPYMASALKKWLLKGHDVFVLSEPYAETANGKVYQKKRFYFIFTDVRLSGNFYDRVMQSIDFAQFPEVKMFHLSAEHPTKTTDGAKHFKLNPNIEARQQGFGSHERQEWQIAWRDGVEPLVISGVDPSSGAQLPNGDWAMKGIKVDKNSLGSYRITGVETKVYDINTLYADYVAAMEARQKFDLRAYGSPEPVSDFLVVDKKAFDRDGSLVLHFVPEMYYPQSVLTGSPYNYTKVDICVSAVEPLFDQHESMFKFGSIDVPGAQNVSVASSIQQCLTDPKVKEKVLTTPIYSIYIKSPEY